MGEQRASRARVAKSLFEACRTRFRGLSAAGGILSTPTRVMPRARVGKFWQFSPIAAIRLLDRPSYDGIDGEPVTRTRKIRLPGTEALVPGMPGLEGLCETPCRFPRP